MLFINNTIVFSDNLKEYPIELIKIVKKMSQKYDRLDTYSQRINGIKHNTQGYVIEIRMVLVSSKQHKLLLSKAIQ